MVRDELNDVQATFRKVTNATLGIGPEARAALRESFRRICSSAMPLSSDPEGKRLPIKLDSTSNGEFMPIPLDATNQRANQLAQRSARENARRRGVDRRAFMVVDQPRGQCFAVELIVSTGRTTESMSRPKPPEAVAERPVFTNGWSCAHNHP